MASIRKIEGKKGISYKIEVSNGYDVNGKKIRETTTFVPDPSMTKKQPLMWCVCMRCSLTGRHMQR